MQESMSQRKAIVLGGTGLIGNELIQLLIENSNYSEIRVLGRRNTEHKNPKVKFYPVDLSHISDSSKLFEVEDVFCCLGTTMKKAGSKEAFKRVDYDMIVNGAKSAEGKIQNFVLISSLGANPQSGNFYLKTKGETERDVNACNIPSISILRPSILFGNRHENRLGEKIGIWVMKAMGPLLVGGLKKYRGNEATTVAKAMIIYALENKPGRHVYESIEFEKKVAETL
jgi:uncharacterized protein YbjT (DUF2867 family)